MRRTNYIILIKRMKREVHGQNHSFADNLYYFGQILGLEKRHQRFLLLPKSINQII